MGALVFGALHLPRGGFSGQALPNFQIGGTMYEEKITPKSASRFYGVSFVRYDGTRTIQDPEGLVIGWELTISLPLLGRKTFRRTYANQDHPSFQSRDVF